MEKNNERLSLAIKIQIGLKFERNIETNINVTFLLYKEFERYIEVRHL